MTTYKHPILATISAPAHRHLGTNINSPVWNDMRELVFKLVIAHNIQTHASAMMPGLDQMCAALMSLLIKDIIVIRPFEGHHKLWPPKEQELADLNIKCATDIITISNKPTRQSVTDANARIVDIADELLILDAHNSITAKHAIERASEQHKTIHLLKDAQILDPKAYVTID